ncbi:MAG: metallophosphoesterase [Anaerolineae bacterium]|nr:metallophosphoesterase [Anaerolineae bacterium]
MIPASLYTLLFNIVALCLVMAALLFLQQLGERRSHIWAGGLGLAGLVCLLMPVSRYTGTQFGIIRLIACIVFIHFPIYMLGLSFIFSRQSPWLAKGYLALAVIVILVGVDAFIIEPQWLDVTKFTLQSEKLTRPIRLVLLADIQTNRIGKYEHRIMSTALAQKPDLLLFAGDYIHLPWNSVDYQRELENFQTLLAGFDLEISLGAYAVAGNVDESTSWSSAFGDSPVITIQETTSFDLGEVILSGLSLRDAANTQTTLLQQDKYHIVLGHNPNYSMGDIRADLLLAGHTHGGQVQLPLIGPLLTLSAVPRPWASGITEISSGRVLVVSRGVGLERMDAPRMRFLCRPEIIVIDLVPA